MNPLIAYIILIAMAIGCFVGGNFCDPGPAQQGLVGLGGLLVGLIMPHLPTALAGLGATPKAADDTPTAPLGPKAAAVLLLAGSLLLVGSAHASPEWGGCILDGRVCFGPAAALTVGKYQGGKFSAGLMPGACYEAVAYPERWYSFGASVCGQLEVGGPAPNQGGVSGLLSFANWFRGGLSRVWTEQPEGPAKGEWAALFGFGTMIGGSPKYVASQGAR